MRNKSRRCPVHAQTEDTTALSCPRGLSALNSLLHKELPFYVALKASQKFNCELTRRNLNNKTSNFSLLLVHPLQKLAIPHQAFP